MFARNTVGNGTCSSRKGAQYIVALTQMVAQFEDQKHIEIKREVSEYMQMREPMFRGEARDMSGDIRSE